MMRVSNAMLSPFQGGYHTAFNVQGVRSSFDQADQWADRDFSKVSVVGTLNDGTGKPMNIPLFELF